MAEYGQVAAKGLAHVQRLIERIEDPTDVLGPKRLRPRGPG